MHLFDVVTQYRAIFPDDDSVRVNYGGSKSKGDGPVDGALFYSWVNDKVCVSVLVWVCIGIYLCLWNINLLKF